MGFFQAIGTCYSKSVIWKDRATRSEFWWFFLYQCLMGGLLTAVMVGGLFYLAMSQPELLSAPPFDPGAPISGLSDLPRDVWMWLVGLNVVYFFAFWLPGLSVLVRRLHDSGHSGWWYWIALIPVVGLIILTVLLILPGDGGHNRFGAPPGGAQPFIPLGADTRAMRKAQKAARKGGAVHAMTPEDEFRDYYRCTVEPAIQRAKAGQA